MRARCGISSAVRFATRAAAGASRARTAPAESEVRLLVFNPVSASGAVAWLRFDPVEHLRAQRRSSVRLQTRGDGGDVARIAAAIRAERPELVIAAGGDGTVRDVVQAVLDVALADPPAVAIVPLGTANNFARSLGLLSLRRDGDAAVERLRRTLADGRERAIDVGLANGCCFVGSFACGMDADILATRNRWRALLRLRSGYALYLASCAFNACRPHGSRASLAIDGAPPLHLRRLYNLVVLNTAIYAGEFRFAAADSCDDGRLDLHLFSGTIDYLSRYPAAWRRHVRYERGEEVRPPSGARRFADVRLEAAAPLRWQLDGELMSAASTLQIKVVPGAIRVLAPSADPSLLPASPLD
jgi:diacylglycerol kinase family enzyme